MMSVEQFRLIEPGGVHRCEARSPSRLLLEVVFGSRCGMAGSAILNQKHTAQVPMVLSKLMQRLDVMVSVFIRRAGRFHASAVPDQKQQYVDRAMAYVLKLRLFNRAGNRPADRLASMAWRLGISSTQTTPRPLRSRRPALA
jgi:hypothetical protein